MVDGPSAMLRRRLVEHLRQAGFVADPRIVDAFLAVPRETFLTSTHSTQGLVAVYRDDAIVTRRDPDSNAPISSSSQPAIMAIMLEMLAVEPGQRVLEIGAGTGYNAALLDHLVGAGGLVVSMEIDLEIARGAAKALRAVGSRAHTVVGDGAVGIPGFGLGGKVADRIVVTASSTAVPRPWHEQLAPGGRLVVPLRLSAEIERAHAVTSFERTTSGFRSIAVSPGGFMPLRRSDGTTFDPGQLPTATLRRREFAAPSFKGGGRSPFARINRSEMDRLRIVVSYDPEPPETRWQFSRGDHWIGVDVEGP